MGNGTFTVCGAGAAGTAIAGDLALKGLPVTLYELPAFEKGIEEIRSRQGVEITPDSRTTSGKTGFAPLQLVTTEAKEAVENAEVLMITVPALNHEAFVDELVPHLQPGQFVLFNTGYWGSLRFQRKLAEAGLDGEVTLCESNIMPYLSKRMSAHETKIFNAKKVMTVAAFPGSRTGEAFSALSPAYSEYKALPNILWTNISSGGNACVHVQLTLPIMGYVFDRFQGCKFYTEATDQFSLLSSAFDRERAPLADRLSCSPIETGSEWAENAYGYTGRHIADAFRKSPHSDTASAVLRSRSSARSQSAILSSGMGGPEVSVWWWPRSTRRLPGQTRVVHGKHSLCQARLLHQTSGSRRSHGRLR